MSTVTATDNLQKLLQDPLIVIDPDVVGKVFCVRGITQQQLTALEDCDYIIIHPLLNVQYREGNWEAIPIGTMSESNGVVLLRQL